MRKSSDRRPASRAAVKRARSRCRRAGAFRASNPAFQRARDPKAIGAGARHGAQRIERFAGIPAQGAVVSSGLPYECGARAVHLLGNRHPDRSTVPLVEKDLDAAARFLLFRFPASRRGRTTAAQAVQYTLDVLAAPQAVDAMVPAPARVDMRVQRTNLHRVAAAARRRDPIVAEWVRTLVERVHLDNLGPAAPLPAPDLVRIRRDPSLKRRWPIIVQALAPERGLLSRFVHGMATQPRSTGRAAPLGAAFFDTAPAIASRLLNAASMHRSFVSRCIGAGSPDRHPRP